MKKNLILAALMSCLVMASNAAVGQNGRVTSSRHAGPTRFETAIATAQALYPLPQKASGAIIARSDNPADSMTVAPLARLLGHQPLLVTMRDQLHPGVRDELKRLVQPGGTITIAGGPQAITPAVEEAIKALGFRTDRVAGETRSDTAVKIANRVHAIQPVKEVFIADGGNWHEALMLAPVAAHRQGVVLLSNGPLNPKETVDWVESHSSTVRRVAGFQGEGSNSLLTDPWLSWRTAESSISLAWDEFDNPKQVGVVTLADFPDALSAAALMANVDGPIVFSGNRADSKPLHSGLDVAILEEGTRPEIVHVFGGEKAIAPQIVDAITDPSWTPRMQIASGSGCNAPRGSSLPDGTWYGWIAGGEGMGANEKGNAIVELFYVCYDEVTRKWQPAKSARNRLLFIESFDIFEKMYNRNAGDLLGKFAVRNDVIVDWDEAPTEQKLDTGLYEVEACILEGCDYWNWSDVNS